MPTLTREQILLYARSAGLPEIFADIAMAESSGRTDVVNSIGCVGLWQINQPVHVKDHPTWTVEWLKVPSNNATAAATLYRASGFDPWVSSRGKWGAGKSPGRGPGLPGLDDIPIVGGALDTAGDVASGVGTIASGVSRAASWASVPYNWVRVVEVVGGVALVLVGVNLVVTVPVALRTAGVTAARRVGAVAGRSGS